MGSRINNTVFLLFIGDHSLELVLRFVKRPEMNKQDAELNKFGISASWSRLGLLENMSLMEKHPSAILQTIFCFCRYSCQKWKQDSRKTKCHDLSGRYAPVRDRNHTFAINL